MLWEFLLILESSDQLIQRLSSARNKRDVGWFVGQLLSNILQHIQILLHHCFDHILKFLAIMISSSQQRTSWIDCLQKIGIIFIIIVIKWYVGQRHSNSLQHIHIFIIIVLIAFKCENLQCPKLSQKIVISKQQRILLQSNHTKQ